MECELWEVWQLWYAEEDLAVCTLWGRSIVWWGRVGKVLEFAAACSIVIEVVGPQRLRNFSAATKELINPHRVIQAIITYSKWIVLRMLEAVARWYSVSDWSGTLQAAAQRLSHQSSGMSLGFSRTVKALSFVITAALLLLFVIRVADNDKELPGITTLIVGLVLGGFILWAAYNVLTYLIVPFLLYALSVPVLLATLLVDVLLVKPFAWILERPKLGAAVKLCSVFFLSIGFHFSLLAG